MNPGEGRQAGKSIVSRDFRASVFLFVQSLLTSFLKNTWDSQLLKNVHISLQVILSLPLHKFILKI